MLFKLEQPFGREISWKPMDLVLVSSVWFSWLSENWVTLNQPVNVPDTHDDYVFIVHTGRK